MCKHGIAILSAILLAAAGVGCSWHEYGGCPDGSCGQCNTCNQCDTCGQCNDCGHPHLDALMPWNWFNHGCHDGCWGAGAEYCCTGCGDYYCGDKDSCCDPCDQCGHWIGYSNPGVSYQQPYGGCATCGGGYGDYDGYVGTEDFSYGEPVWYDVAGNRRPRTGPGAQQPSYASRTAPQRAMPVASDRRLPQYTASAPQRTAQRPDAPAMRDGGRIEPRLANSAPQPVAVKGRAYPTTQTSAPQSPPTATRATYQQRPANEQPPLDVTPRNRPLPPRSSDPWAWLYVD